MQNPAPLIWNDSLMTGVPEIDEQHRILVHTFNEAAESLCGETRREVLEAITQDLLSYALYHFETEELLMRDAGYESEDGADDVNRGGTCHMNNVSTAANQWGLGIFDANHPRD